MGHGHAHHHDHHHGHAHPHGHAIRSSARALGVAFLLNLAFTLVEVAGGLWTNSIAVLTDALHDAGDCLVLGVAWALQRVALKGRDARYSYGYGRYSMLGGWITAMVLIAGAVVMFMVSVPRLWQPSMPHTTGMMGLAVFGLVMNGLAAWRLHGGATLNERGAYLHLLEDVLGWAAVLVGAILIHFTGWTVVDPLLSMAIGLYILTNAIRTLRQGTGILMQEVPPGVDHALIEQRILAIPGVKSLHDQHSWTLDGSFLVHTLHVVVSVPDLSEAQRIRVLIRKELLDLGVHHATIELEREGEQCPQAPTHAH